MKIKQLTKAEEEIMQKLWQLKDASVKQIQSEFDDPAPAVSTVSTIVRILESKGFVGHKKVGRGYTYHPLISQEDYSQRFMGSFVQRYFSGSYKELVSSLVRDQQMNLKDLEELINQIKEEE
jgi:predicted transcriptional regulator